jgi:hypothetical protein
MDIEYYSDGKLHKKRITTQDDLNNFPRGKNLGAVKVSFYINSNNIEEFREYVRCGNVYRLLDNIQPALNNSEEDMKQLLDGPPVKYIIGSDPYIPPMPSAGASNSLNADTETKKKLADVFASLFT